MACPDFVHISLTAVELASILQKTAAEWISQALLQHGRAPKRRHGSKYERGLRSQRQHEHWKRQHVVVEVRNLDNGYYYREQDCAAQVDK